MRSYINQVTRHERRRPGEPWTPVAVVRFLWPKDLLDRLATGEQVTFDGYEWRKAANTL